MASWLDDFARSSCGAGSTSIVRAKIQTATVLHAPRCQKWLALGCLLGLAALSRPSASANAVGVLWFNQSVNEATVIWQILPSGHVFVRADLYRKDGGIRVESITQYAYQFDPTVYDRARTAMVQAGLRDGAFMECGERARAGITPQLQLNLVSKDCKQVGGVLEAVERLIGPVSQNVIQQAQRWADELQRRAHHCPMGEVVNVELAKGALNRVDRLPSGVAACFLTPSFLETEWKQHGRPFAAVEYTAQLQAAPYPPFPTTLLIPEDGPVPLVHGFDPISALDAKPTGPWEQGTRAIQAKWLLPLAFSPSADSDAKVAWFDWPPGYPRRGGFAPSLAIWLLPPIWTQSLSIELKDGRDRPARVAMRDGQITCEGFRFCTDLTEPRVRGLVAGAMGACIAVGRERRREKNKSTVELEVQAAELTCKVRFHGFCVNHLHVGLDAVVDSREPPHVFKPPRKLYPICGYASP